MSDRIFTIITGHGKLDFVKRDDGNLVIKSVNDKPLSENKIGKLGSNKCQRDCPDKG